jgi:hypothetical protein
MTESSSPENINEFRKLSDFHWKSIGMQKAIRSLQEAKSISECLPATRGIRLDTSLNSDSRLVSFVN